MQPRGPQFKSRSDHKLDMFLSSPEFNPSATLVDSQLVYLPPVGVFSHVTMYVQFDYLFMTQFQWSACELAVLAKCTISTINNSIYLFF